MTINADQLADAMASGDSAVNEALAAAVPAINAWVAWPRYTRDAYPAEARRLAGRAARLLMAVVAAADQRNRNNSR